jgi:hypothetical protein
MSVLHQNPYRGLTPEELHVVIRRAHAERAQALRAFFAGLFAPRKKAAEHPDAEAAAACR